MKKERMYLNPKGHELSSLFPIIKKAHNLYFKLKRRTKLEDLTQKHLSYLGLRVKDKVTGQEGIVTTVSFDLYGCIQVVIHPGTNKDNGIIESHWFDINRLDILDDIPVMDRPDFVKGDIAKGKKGPAEKTAFKN